MRSEPDPKGTAMAEADGVIRGAVISDDQRYRYQLVRGWSGEPPIVWVMLNPSTADGTQDDHTIRKIVQFSRNWGYGSLTVVNLFALRATKPTALVDQHRGGDD